MRTTLTIDDSLAELLKKQAWETGKPFKQVVNEALRAGLEHSGAARSPRPYRVEPASMGSARPGIDLDKALTLASELEEDELERKMELRK
ncbi:MAG: hypothetical protein RQ729_13035 [Wenzhouxiangellaceae bacterium]|nr:hypothetical protein [Wenzhouxiangellaceae bacterium]